MKQPPHREGEGSNSQIRVHSQSIEAVGVASSPGGGRSLSGLPSDVATLSGDSIFAPAQLWPPVGSPAYVNDNEYPAFHKQKSLSHMMSALYCK